MTTVLITGASGTLGRSLLSQPAAEVHSIRALSRAETVDDRSPIEWRRGDLATGVGLDSAMAGVDTVIHAASSPRQDTERIDVEGTERLVGAARRAGVRHFVFVSIVGIDRVPYAYYRHKLAAEQAVRSSGEGLPWTIVRGTQFHTFMDRRFAGMTRYPIAWVPRRFVGQPIDVAEFADFLWARADGQPLNGIVEAAGPEVLTWREMLDTWMDERGVHKRLLEVPIFGRRGAAWRRGDATAPARAVGRLTWRAWVRARYGEAARG